MQVELSQFVSIFTFQYVYINTGIPMEATIPLAQVRESEVSKFS